MSKEIPYTITNESISLVYQGRPHTIKKGTANFGGMLDALLSANWDAVPNHLSDLKSMAEWLKSFPDFTTDDVSISFKGERLPSGFTDKIREMVVSGVDPSKMLNFHRRLQRNPSFRAVQAVWHFISHRHLPLTDDGCFLGYKSVRMDYFDHHSNKFENRPGSILSLDRNKVSDDPNVDCSYGFHVGTLKYADGFHSGSRRIMVVKVAPENVVSVPYDADAEKIRVCEYEVFGHYNDVPLSSTTHVVDSHDPVPDAESGSSVLFDNGNVPEPTDEDVQTRHERPKVKRGFVRLDKMSVQQLLALPINDLRHYAGKGLDIVGASKVPGGKAALIALIVKTRGHD